MAMNCCHKEHAEVCEILVCVDFPAPYKPDLDSRLRFGLLASSWLPIPLGGFLWSALHVMLLLVVGPLFWVLGLLAVFLLCSVLLFGGGSILAFILYMVVLLIGGTIDMIFLLGRSIRIRWAPVPFLVRREREAIGDDCADAFSKVFWTEMRKSWGTLRIGVPCMSDSLYQEMKSQKWETWARWWEEVVHKHDAIAL